MNLVIDFILVGGIFITLLILFLLFKAKKKMLPQKLLILFFGILLFYLLNGYADIHGIDILYIITFLFNDCIEIFLGPLIFIYIKSLFEENKILVKKNWFHFTPTILYVGFITIPFMVSIFMERYWFDYLRILNENSEIAVSVLMSYLIFYIILSLRLFYKYRRAMLGNFSTIDDVDFEWVKKMLIGTLIVSCLDELVSFYEIFSGELDWDTQYITAVSVIVLIGYLGYYGVNQTKILLPDFLIQETTSTTKIKEKSTSVAGFGSSESKKLQTKLETTLLTEKPYLDEELTLGKLARMVNTTDKKLSTLLNQQMNTTFYDLINRHRVDSVKEKLNSQEFENLTLLGIAYESGFKSKTSFNRIFKRETGLSPSAYRELLQAKIEPQKT